MAFTEELSTIALIDSMSNQFTKTDWKIVQFIKRNPESFTTMAAAEIAELIGTSDASIIRFAQKIGFNGFYELRTKYKRELEKQSDDTDIEYATQFQNDYTLAIQRLFSVTDEQTIHHFIDNITQAHHIHICAFKQFNYIANLVADKFLLLGIKMKAITSMNEFRLYVAQAQKNDLFIVVDLNADIPSLNIEFDILKKHNSSIILISELQKSKLNDISDMHLLIPKTTDLLSEFAISTNVLILVLVDLLFNALLQSNPNKFSISLAESIELTKTDHESQKQTSKIRALFEK